MKISGVFIRFAAAYIGLVVVVLVGFGLAGVQPNSGVNAGVLIAAAWWSCLAFGEKNARYFSSAEKTRVVWGMITIDLLIQLAVAIPLLGSVGAFPVGALLAGVAFVMALHAIGIYFTVGYAGKIFAKQQAKKLAKAGA